MVLPRTTEKRQIGSIWFDERLFFLKLTCLFLIIAFMDHGSFLLASVYHNTNLPKDVQIAQILYLIKAINWSQKAYQIYCFVWLLHERGRKGTKILIICYLKRSIFHLLLCHSTCYLESIEPSLRSSFLFPLTAELSQVSSSALVANQE